MTPPPGKTTPLRGPKESNPVKIDFQHWRTPPRARLSPSSHAIVRYCSRSVGALPARCHSSGIAERPPTELVPARHSTANCTPLAAHSVRSDPSTDGLCRSHDVHKLRPPTTPASANPEAPPRRESRAYPRTWFGTPSSPDARLSIVCARGSPAATRSPPGRQRPLHTRGACGGRSSLRRCDGRADSP